MGRNGRDVTEAELAILEVLWEEGPVTPRRLIDRLYPSGGPSAHPTVQKLLERLEAKGCIERDRSGPVQVVSAAIRRNELIEHGLKTMADRLCGGSLVSLLSHLVDPLQLGAKDRKAVRDLLEKLEEPKPGRERDKRTS
jgi:predicted transcriptional regulator